MTGSEQPLDRRQYVTPGPDVRVEENWRAIEQRMEQSVPIRKPGTSRRYWMAAAVVTAAAAAAAIAFWPSAPANQWMGTTLASGDQIVDAVLEDGSAVLVDPHSRLERLSDAEASGEMRIRLAEGRATFDVTRNPERTFIVHAKDVEVRVIGTRFTVANGNRVQVSVERGAVDVRHGESVVRVRPGESWIDPGVEIANVRPPQTEVEELAEPEVPEPELAEAQRPTPMVEVRQPTASDLFDAAREARRNGDARQAGRLYEQFLERHSGHTNAGLAALELGRLRMDALGNPRGAAAAFRLAMRRGNSAFRQDASARLVQALDRAGDRMGCEAQKRAHLARYPSGRHAGAIRSACQ